MSRILDFDDGFETEAPSTPQSLSNADFAADAGIEVTKLEAMTSNRALVSNPSGFISPSAVTSTELEHLSGVTSSVQTQIDSKQTNIAAATTSDYYRGDKTFATLNKAAVGLSNVDNTSDAAKNSASAVLINKDFDGGTASDSSRITLPKETTSNLDALTRKQGTVVYDTSTNSVKFDNGTTLVSLAGVAPASFYAVKVGGDQNGDAGINGFGTPVKDSAGGLNISTGEYTIQPGFDGDYNFHIDVNWASAQGVAWGIFKNGSLWGDYGSSTASTFYISKSQFIPDLVAGDVITFRSGTPSVLSIVAAVITGFKVG